LPGLRIHRVPVVFADALHEQHAARDIAVGSDLVRTVGRNCATLAHGKQDALGRLWQRLLGASV
jgi:hypothetical protein